MTVRSVFPQALEQQEVPDNWFDATPAPMTTEEALTDAVADIMYQMDMQKLGLEV